MVAEKYLAKPDHDSKILTSFQSQEETTCHLFFHCGFSAYIWDYFLEAFGQSWVIEGNLIQHLYAWERKRESRLGKSC
ncbi:hypothetical protein BVC80_1543g222 [Macleaya cordata]|uniref:Uncharacterized protein n=1 Tax=Macleaya cordata TaxID=56857 RepID=A0A200R219_MACCD|nr:hypothetical protein BVC80_1543g222 [Macleaya cordata]